MRTEFLLTDADASITQIGAYEIDCGQDMRWMLAINSSGLDGIPKIYVEETADNVDWMPLNNNDCEGILDYFPMDDDLISKWIVSFSVTYSIVYFTTDHQLLN